jgi:hypothetical protein
MGASEIERHSMAIPIHTIFFLIEFMFRKKKWIKFPKNKKTKFKTWSLHIKNPIILSCCPFLIFWRMTCEHFIILNWFVFLYMCCGCILKEILDISKNLWKMLKLFASVVTVGFSFLWTKNNKRMTIHYIWKITNQQVSTLFHSNQIVLYLPADRSGGKNKMSMRSDNTRFWNGITWAYLWGVVYFWPHLWYEKWTWPMAIYNVKKKFD